MVNIEKVISNNVNKNPFVSWDENYCDEDDFHNLLFSLGVLLNKRFKGYCKVSMEGCIKPSYLKLELAKDSAEYALQVIEKLYPVKAINKITVYGVTNRKGLVIKINKTLCFLITPCADSKYIKHCKIGHE